jgi:hypothetical protein
MLGPTGKRQLRVACKDAGEGREQEAISFAALAKGMTIACVLRLDLTFSCRPEYDIHFKDFLQCLMQVSLCSGIYGSLVS